MFASIDEMVELYKRIVNGSASEEEKLRFGIYLDTACLDKNYILDQIKRKIDKTSE